MVWQFLTFLSLAAAIALHFWWRARVRAVAAAAQCGLHELTTRQENTARQNQAQQQAIFDSMIEGLVLLDQDGRIQVTNRAFGRLFGIAADVREKPIIEAVRHHELADLVNSLGPGQPVAQAELRLVSPAERCLQVNAAAVFTSTGERHGSILVFHDLTRIKHLERARQEFVANVSHELRTPLSLIKGYAETLADGAKDKPEVATRFLSIIDRNAERLRLLIDDLLTLSELESGRVNLNPAPVPLQPLGRKVLADFKTAAAGKNMTLLEEIPTLMVQADAARLEQVLCNLVDNAIKYGRSGGKVVLAAKTLDNGQIEASVEDDGPGIPAEAIERVFERFYRVDKARSREQGGTGLGLSIVKHIVQNHGGHVWARSEPGRGATFYFTLPAAKATL